MRLVDTSPEATALRSAALDCANQLFTLSISAGGLAGLLQLISGSEDLPEQQRMAVGALADMAQKIENEITAIADRLGHAEGNQEG